MRDRGGKNGDRGFGNLRETTEKAIHGGERGERGGWPPAWIGMGAAGDGEENASVKSRCP